MNRNAFLPPIDNPLVLGIMRRALPALMRWHAGGIEVELSDADLARLTALKGQRVLLLPNHPTHFDPLVMFELSGRLGEAFRYVACREAFFPEKGLRGWLFQRCGVYSLIRGTADRDSFALTQSTLVEGRHWLTIFIEGEVTLENDTLIPFEPGVLSLAMRAQETLAKSPDTSLNAAGIHAIPIALRTTYKPGIEKAVSEALVELEEHVGLAPTKAFTGWADSRARIINIGQAVLGTIERTYRLTPAENESVESRLSTVKNHMLSRMEAYLDLQPVPGLSPLDRIRAVQLKIDRIIHAYGEVPKTTSAYELALLEKRREAFVDFYADIERLLNVLTLRGGYLDNATPERFAEVIQRLQNEILGKRKLTHPRVVKISVGQPTNLRDHLDAFRSDKRRTSGELARQFESEMSAMLKSPVTVQQRPTHTDALSAKPIARESSAEVRSGRWRGSGR